MSAPSGIRSINLFRQAVENGESIICNEDGTWDVRWKITSLFRWILGWQKEDDVEIARFFKKHLKHYEVKSQTFTNKFTDDSFENLTSTYESIQKRLKGYVEEETKERRALKAERSRLEKELQTADQSQTQLSKDLKNVKDALKALRQKQPASRNLRKIEKHLIARQLRKLPQEQIFHAKQAVLAQDREWLIEKVKKWKAKQFPKLSKEMSKDESDRIQLTLKLPRILNLLKTDPLYRANFFKCVFRNTVGALEAKDAVTIATQFPTIQKRIAKGFLDKRVKRLKNKGLLFHEQVIRDGSSLTVKKDVTLLMRGKHVSLIDDSQKISFHDGSVKTIRQLFKEVFEEKDNVQSLYEYLANGIDLINEPDLGKPDFYKDFPEWETLTRDELQKRYPQADLNSGHGLITVKASRENQKEIQVDGNHAWFEIAMPREDGRFSIFSFGKWAQVFPKSMATLSGKIEYFFFVFGTKKGKIVFVDDNEFYYHREHYAVPLVVDKQHMDRFFERLRADMIRVKNGEFVFQAQGDNCSNWVQEVLDDVFREKNLPRLFEIEQLKTTAPFPVNKVLDFLNYLKDNISSVVSNEMRLLIAYFFGASEELEITSPGKKEKVYKNLIDYSKFRQGVQSIPAMLFHTGESLQRAIQMPQRERRRTRKFRASPV